MLEYAQARKDMKVFLTREAGGTPPIRSQWQPPYLFTTDKEICNELSVAGII